VGAQHEEQPVYQSLVELPMLTRADSERYVDGILRINMLKQASSKNPYSYAVINKIKVYEGQNIPHTRLKLIGVDFGGIGVKVRDSNLRYYIPF